MSLSPSSGHYDFHHSNSGAARWQNTQISRGIGLYKRGLFFIPFFVIKECVIRISYLLVWFKCNQNLFVRIHLGILWQVLHRFFWWSPLTTKAGVNYQDSFSSLIFKNQAQHEKRNGQNMESDTEWKFWNIQALHSCQTGVVCRVMWRCGRTSLRSISPPAGALCWQLDVVWGTKQHNRNSEEVGKPLNMTVSVSRRHRTSVWVLIILNNKKPCSNYNSGLYLSLFSKFSVNAWTTTLLSSRSDHRLMWLTTTAWHQVAFYQKLSLFQLFAARPLPSFSSA